LVEAAAEVFSERGYDGAGVHEIARRAGLTTGAIYSRFSGKAELLAEAIRAESGTQLDQLLSAGDRTPDAARLIAKVGAQLPVREPTRKQFLLLEAFVAARRDPELAVALRADLAEARSNFTRLIELGQRTGDLDPAVDTESIVHFAQAVAFGFLIYEAIDAPQPDLERWTSLIERLVDALRPSSSATGSAPAAAAPEEGNPS
jgi:AcrR family transcriptional regulator